MRGLFLLASPFHPYEVVSQTSGQTVTGRLKQMDPYICQIVVKSRSSKRRTRLGPELIALISFSVITFSSFFLFSRFPCCHQTGLFLHIPHGIGLRTYARTTGLDMIVWGGKRGYGRYICTKIFSRMDSIIIRSTQPKTNPFLLLWFLFFFFSLLLFEV